MFKTATKHESKLRLALIGPAGSGKTYSALAIASALSDKIAVMDTEHGSASKYADLFKFDTCEPDTFSPQVYIDTIHEAEAAGYGVLVIDSLSHAWMGKDGALELVDKAAARMKSANNFVAWRDVTPLHNRLIDTIIASRLHIIATMRSKMEYVQDKGSDGRTTIRKVGMQPVQRDGLEYEFDVVGDLDQENNLIITKTRCGSLANAQIHKPGRQLAETLAAWLSGAPAPQRPNRNELAAAYAQIAKRAAGFKIDFSAVKAHQQDSDAEIMRKTTAIQAMVAQYETEHPNEEPAVGK